MNKKILIVLGSLSRGGAERVASIISDEFCRKGWDVTIALLLYNKVEYSMNPKVKVVDLSGNPDASRWLRLPGWISGIRRYIKISKPDVILSFAARINIITQVALVGLDIPIVVSERNDPQYDGRGPLVDLMTNLLYPYAKTVVFQTKRAQRYFNSRIRENSTIITNPIEVFSSRAENVCRGKIVSVGRLVPQKNQRMLIEAFALACNQYPDMVLYIYGDGPLKKTLEELACRCGVGDKVHLVGNMPNVHHHIADAEMFVLSSDYEGLSNALLEAMMLGLPCISTACAGSDEYIKQGINGILTTVGSRTELVEAIIQLHENCTFADKLGLNAHKASEYFAREKVIEQWCNVIEKHII